MVVTPLVSCILATRGRPAFVRQAVRCFESQTYPMRELVVVDNGVPSVRELCLGRRGVRYIRLPADMTTGAKLNIGIGSASGDILHKFDDDDYYHPRFLETAMKHWPETNQDRTILAWDSFLVLIKGDPLLRHSGPGWRAGGTLCFSRALWERQPFRDLPRSVDSRFLDDHQQQARVVRVRAPELYIVVRHGGNTWKQFSDGEAVESFFRKLTPFPKPVDQVVARRDRDFYRALVTAAPPASTRRRSAAAPARPGRRPRQTG